MFKSKKELIYFINEQHQALMTAINETVGMFHDGSVEYSGTATGTIEATTPIQEDQKLAS